jgi:membrane protein required for colicin V production
MNWVDIAIVAVVLISTIVSLIRGFVREVLSLAVWIAAFWVAIRYAEALSVQFAAQVSTPSVRMGLAFAVLFLTTLLIGALINYLIFQLVDRTGLSGTDRFVGMFFGAARGVALVALLVLLAGMTPVTGDPWWHDSQLLPHFEKLALWLKGFLPAHLATSIDFAHASPTPAPTP